MAMIPVFSYTILGAGTRKNLQEMGFEHVEGRGKECRGMLCYGSDDEDGSKKERDAFHKLAEKLTRKGAKLGVEVCVHKVTRYMTRKQMRAFAQELQESRTA
ncbi:MAG: hypothetical protein EOO38_00300 [Cytophagaceae bacterium]|nr:MAG: hypothetical protein EOO38_00300 [Cytophagaceae bacterium]